MIINDIDIDYDIDYDYDDDDEHARASAFGAVTSHALEAVFSSLRSALDIASLIGECSLEKAQACAKLARGIYALLSGLIRK